MNADSISLFSNNSQPRIPSSNEDYESLGTGSLNREMQRAESCLGEERYG